MLPVLCWCLLHSWTKFNSSQVLVVRVLACIDLDIFRRAYRQDLETHRGATLQDTKILVEKQEQDPKSLREMKQEHKNFPKSMITVCPPLDTNSTNA